jgi:trans-2,3-dihydro-3-hydroxyanthranilate isomerase
MTRSYPFTQVDAFTTIPLGGNPCAILFDTDDLDEETMQAIARENNLSETSFVRKPASADADVGVRYFTPSAEIPLAGHPTIATAYALVESGRLRLSGDVTTVTFELRVGPIRVDIHSKDGKVERIVMTQKKPQFLAIFDAERVMPLFGLAPHDAIDAAPVQIVSTGTLQLMVCVKSLHALERISYDNAALMRFSDEAGFFGAHIFTRHGVTERGQTFARHIVAGPNGFEDPFTGSATGGMGAYLWHHGLIDLPVFIAEQGHWMGKPGEGMVEVVGPSEDIESVKVGGAAVTVIRGEMTI